MGLNKCIIMGRLGKDVELRKTPGGISVASAVLAVDRDFKDKATGEKATDWIDVVAWRNTAEFFAKNFSKGRMVAVEGRMQVREWTDKEGNKRRSAEVVADNIYFADGGKRGNQEPAQDMAPGGFYDIPDDEPCPF